MNDSAYLDYWINAAKTYLSDQCFTPLTFDVMEYIESVSDHARIWFSELNLKTYRDFDIFWGGSWLLNLEEPSFVSDFILHQLAGFCLSLNLSPFILRETELETISPIFLIPNYWYFFIRFCEKDSFIKESVELMSLEKCILCADLISFLHNRIWYFGLEKSTLEVFNFRRILEAGIQEKIHRYSTG